MVFVDAKIRQERGKTKGFPLNGVRGKPILVREIGESLLSCSLPNGLGKLAAGYAEGLRIAALLACNVRAVKEGNLLDV